MKQAEPERPYESWSQLAGYFDGDGSIVVRKISKGVPFTLNVAVEFVDQSEMQVRMIGGYLTSNGIKTGKVAFRSRAWRIEVGTVDGVLRLLESMAPYLCKKAAETKAAVEYLKGLMTGNEFQQVLEREVRLGNRERVGAFANLPWTRTEGSLRALEFAHSSSGRKPSLDEAEEVEIVRAYMSGSSQRQLAKAKGLSRGVVRRTLERRGWICAKNAVNAV